MSETKVRASWVRPLFLFLAAAGAVAIVLAAREVLLPFVLALVIAYVLTPFVAWFERRGMRRSVAILVAYAVVLGTLAGFLWAIAPRIGREFSGLRKELPALSERANNEWAPRIEAKLRSVGLVPEIEEPEGPPSPQSLQGPPEHGRPALVVRPMEDGRYAVEIGSGIAITGDEHGYLVQAQHDEPKGRFDLNKAINASLKRSLDYARSNALELAKLGRDIVAGISRVIFIFGITLMLAAYLILTRERVVDTFRSLARPSSRPSFDAFLVRVDHGLSGVVRGQLIICLVNGVLSAIGFAAVGLKYWPIVALLATVFSLVPIFGSIASSVPAVALGLTQGPGTALFVLLWILGIHQLEANFLNPKIMGDAAKIHPVLVIFSLLVGEHFFHTAGALLAVPCMSITLSVFGHFRAIAHASDPAFADDPRDSILPPPPPKTDAAEGPAEA